MAAIDKNIKQFFRHRWVLHVGFWLAFYGFALLNELESGKFLFNLDYALHFLVPFLGFVVACYINLYLLIPKFLIVRTYKYYFLYLFLTITLSTLVFLGVQYIIHRFVINDSRTEDVLFLFIHISLATLFFIMISSLFYFLRRWTTMQDIEIKLQEAEKQKVMSELKALKAQLNPHFLFNALNNIYSLSLENNPKTPGIILKLSELMNYILYESRAEKVPVKKEIEFIRNYIELEKSRYEDSIQVSFSSDDNNFENLRIAPLLFIPFIENAFKHCGNGNNNIPKIDIIFDSSHLPLLSIRVMNTKDCSVLDKTGNKGVGLENVKQRLELIYPNRYNLLITENESGFLVDLAIKL